MRRRADGDNSGRDVRRRVTAAQRDAIRDAVQHVPQLVNPPPIHPQPVAPVQPQLPAQPQPEAPAEPLPVPSPPAQEDDANSDQDSIMEDSSATSGDELASDNSGSANSQLDHDDIISDGNSSGSGSDSGGNSSASSGFSEASNLEPVFADPSEIKPELAAWSVKHVPSERAVGELLRILKSLENLSDQLPLTRRALVGTPKGRVALIDMNPGKYYHFGVKNGLKKCLSETYARQEEIGELFVNVNIDGLSVAKSSSSEFWSILASIPNLPGSDVFVIGIYHGASKPEDANDFTAHFVRDLNICIINGFEYEGKNYGVKFHTLICDAPAKSFVTCTKGHTGTCSCYKCTVEGTVIGRTVYFLENDANLRTHTSFINQEQPEHHHEHCELENIVGIDMIKDVVMDPMHLLDLGVCANKFRRLIKKGRDRVPRGVRFQISTRLVALIKYIPSEFARKPRSLSYLERFKATEWSQILFYTAPVILRPLKTQYGAHYDHMLLLHVACRILAIQYSDEDELSGREAEEINYAEELLRSFVVNFRRLHGDNSMSHNIHGLLHLANDVRNKGRLFNFSAYRYENENGMMLRLLKKSGRPLQQFVKRRIEIEKNLKITRSTEPPRGYLVGSHTLGPLPAGCRGPEYKKLKCPELTVTCRKPDNVCVLQDGTIVRVENFCFDQGGHRVIVGRKFTDRQDLFDTPRQSSMMGIWKASTLSDQMTWRLTSFKNKCMMLPFDARNFAIIPLLHGI